MKRGELTRTHILDAGLEMASVLGLESVTIGNLAQKTHMSKSGLFAHFNAKENLQIQILQHAADDFSNSVLLPALKKPGGIQRINTLVKKWIDWGQQLSGGCIFINSSIEYSDRPGKVRDFLLMQQHQWIESLKRLARSAIKAGDFKRDIDDEQFAFDLYSLLLGFHYYKKLLHDPKTRRHQTKALKNLLNRYMVTMDQE